MKAIIVSKILPSYTSPISTVITESWTTTREMSETALTATPVLTTTQETTPTTGMNAFTNYTPMMI